jgi:tripartite-type tricarboxylate transporter receptor subunit TctC
MKSLASTACIGVWLLTASAAFAQAYPTKAVRLIVPGAAGSATDLRARWLAPRLSAALGQPIVVDNRPGGGGTIATEVAARSAPDGYTLLIVHQGTLALNPHIYPRLGYDAISSFAPISLLGTSPLLLAVHPGVPVTSVAGLVSLARQKPGQLNYGSPGTGTPPHIAAELFKRMAAIDAAHVPYKSGAAALLDLTGGRLTYTFDNAVVQLPSVKAGKIRALAVTSAKRVAALPDIRTIAESGLPGYDYSAWQGVVAPAATAQPVVSRVNAEIVRIMATAEARDWFAELGGEPTSDTPREFAAFIKAEHARWGPVIREAGIRPD